MCDAPQHSAQVAIFSQLGHPGFAYSQLFIPQLLMPNLAGYGLLLLFAPMMGLVAACKLVVSAALLGFLLATAWLIAELGGSPLLALLAVLGIYGYPFQWGFIGFLATAPVGICFLVFAIRYFRRPSVSHGIALALSLLAVFICHALLAAFVAGFAAVHAMANVRSARQLFLRWLPILVTVPSAGLLWVHSVANNPVTQKQMEWGLEWDRISEFFTNITGWRSYSTADDMLAAFFVIAAVVALIALLGLRRQWHCYLLFAFCVTFSMFAPTRLFGVDSVSSRFAIFALPGAALAFAPITTAPLWRSRLATSLLLIVALGWTAGVAWRMTIFEHEARGFSTLLSHMEPGQRVLSINFERTSSEFSGAVFLHFPAWYSALKSGVVDPSFACGNVDLVLYRPESMPKVRFADFEFHPERFDWQRHDGNKYRYFVVHSPEERGTKLFTGSEFPVILRAHDGDWWLYENTATSLSSAVHQ